MDNNKEFALRLKSIIDTAIDGIITIDKHGLIDTINPSASEIFQYKQAELAGKNVSVLMNSDHRKKHDGYLHRYLETKIPRIIGIGREVTGRKKDGTIFPFRLAVSEFILHDRIMFTGIIHDLTQTKDAENKLKVLNELLENKIQQRTEELETAINRLLKTNSKLEEREKELNEALKKEMELNDLKSKFVSIASHEFRTPLSTILSSASLIGRYQTAEQQVNRDKHIDKIKSAVNNLNGILSDFLDLSKLEEEKTHVNLEETKLEPLIADIFSEVAGILKPSLKLDSIIPTDFTLLTDKRTLKNILFNLTSNAIKYSENGTISVKAIDNNGRVIISVSDEGMGIPEEDHKHLFQRFFRASNVEGIQGTGLGLSIVKNYVELLKGEITYQSVLGKGSTFVIVLPKKNRITNEGNHS